MGLLGSIKKKQPTEQQHQQHRYAGGGSVDGSGTKKPPLSNKRKTGSTHNNNNNNKWSPLRLSSSSNKTNHKPSPGGRKSTSASPQEGGVTHRSTSASYPSSSILQQLNVVAEGDIEVMTPETRHALMEQRAAIRRELFGSVNEMSTQQPLPRASTSPGRISVSSPSAWSDLQQQHHQQRSMWRSPTTPERGGGGGSGGGRRSGIGGGGKVTPLTADKASLPLSAVSSSFSNDSDGHAWDVNQQQKQQPRSYPMQQTHAMIEQELETSIEATLRGIVVTSGTNEMADLETPAPTTQQLPVWISPEQEEQFSSEKRSAVSGALYRDRSSLKPPAGAPDGSYDEEEEGSRASVNNNNDSHEENLFLSHNQQDTITPLVSNKKVDPSVLNQDAIAKQLPFTFAECGNSPIVDATGNSGSTTRKTPSASHRNVDSLATSSFGMTGSSSLTVPTDSDSSNAFRGRQLLMDAGGVARDVAAAAMECTPTRIRDSILRESGCIGAGANNGNLFVDCVPELVPSSKDTYGETSSFDLSAATRQRSTSVRPSYLDEATAARFLRRITHSGFILLYLQPPRDESGDGDGESRRDDWQGRTITMTINKGETEVTENGTLFRPPQLEWMTVAGGQNIESTTTTVNLMDILDISTDLEDLLLDGEDAPKDEDMCFFTVTTGEGDVYMFEAAHTEERDRIVAGLKTTIARLSFHLIVGDTTAVADLFHSSSSSKNINNAFLAEPPPLTDERQEQQRRMDLLAHTLLDEGYSV